MKHKLLLTIGAIIGSIGMAWALQTTPTTPVGPETGENSTSQAEIFNAARLKLGFTTATAGGTAAAATLTANTAAGVATWPANLTVISNATATLTITNNKVRAGDAAFCMLDSTGAAGASVPEVVSVQVSASQLVCVVSNASATSPAVAVKVYWLVLSAGNPN